MLLFFFLEKNITFWIKTIKNAFTERALCTGAAHDRRDHTQVPFDHALAAATTLCRLT